MGEKIIVEDFDALLTVVVDDGGNGLKRVENTSDDNEVSVEVFKWGNGELVVGDPIAEVF